MADSNKIGLNLLAPNAQLSVANDIQKKLHSVDAGINKILDAIGGEKFARFPTASGGNAGNPEITLKMLKLIGKSLGTTGIASFLAEQQMLAIQNVYTPKVYDPLYFINRTIPGLHKERPLGLLQQFVDQKPGEYEKTIIADDNARMNSHLRVSLPNLSVKYETAIDRVGPHQITNQMSPRYAGADSQDDALLPKEIVQNPFQVGALPGQKILDVGLKLRNSNDPNLKYEDSPLADINQIVDNIIDGKSTAPDDLKIGNIKRKKFNALSLFQKNNEKLGYVPKADKDIRKADTSFKNNVFTRSSFPNGNIPASFEKEDDYSSYLIKSGESITSKLDDDEAYIPLSISDMRPIGGPDGQIRVVYFRPLNTSLQENLAPQWQSDSYFGRTDPVAIYKNTARTFNLSFECHAFYAEDVKAIYEKLNWLSSMVYPMYDYENIIKAGPVCRIRFGDVLKGRNGLGLPGFISNLDFDYSDSIWELKKGSKVPRSVKVSLSFTVLHDMPIGRREDGKFGGIGKFNADNAFVDDNNSIDQEAFRGFGMTGEKEVSNTESDGDRIVDDGK